MTWWGFARLMRGIFGNGLPDLHDIEAQGLLAVKIAQTFALRIDFLDSDRCQHLARLYRATTPVPPESVVALIDRHPDGAWRQRVPDLDPRPLASASVGQVHRARLDSGEEVVVKLIKQDFARRFVADADSVRRLMSLAVFLYPTLQRVADPVAILEDIRQYTLCELDLRNEMAHARVLRDLRDEHANRFDLARWQFPRIFEELSGRNVMVSEYVAGQTLDELLSADQLPYEHLLELFRIQGFCMFCVGTFHGDIHPGNVILSGDDFYFVDTGALGQAGAKLRRGLFRFFEALCAYDYDACAERLNEMAEREIDGPAYRRFREKFLVLYADFRDSTVAQVSLTQKMMDTIKLGVRSGMVFERGMFPIIKSLMYLDGMVLKCRPDAVLMRDMRPFVEEFAALL